MKIAPFNSLVWGSPENCNIRFASVGLAQAHPNHSGITCESTPGSAPPLFHQGTGDRLGIGARLHNISMHAGQ